MEPNLQEDKETRILHCEDQLKTVLSPAEPWIMRAQSLLVWEKPKRSAVLFVCVHEIAIQQYQKEENVQFFRRSSRTIEKAQPRMPDKKLNERLRYNELPFHCIRGGKNFKSRSTGMREQRFFTCSGCRFYSTASTLAIVIYFIHTWKRRIWPEIRVQPKEPEDKDGWTPVHPRLLSVPELCKHLARGWCYMSDLLNGWIKLRRTKPLKFCIFNCIVCGLLALTGTYISDIMLSYIIITSVLLWPSVQYHNLLQKIYLQFEPVFMKLDYSMKNKSKWHYQTVSGSLTTANNNSSGDGLGAVIPENEIDLEEFMPSEDPQIAAALARAITDSEDEGGSLTSSTTPLTFSKEPSILGDDDENQNDLEEELIQGIDAMPSFDDVIDHTDDELLTPDIVSQSKSRESSEEPIRFEPGYFDNSSGSEEETVSDENYNAAQSNPAQTLAESLMANALKQMVGSALQNLAGMTAPAKETKSRSQRDRVAYTHGDSDDEVVFDNVDDGSKDRKEPRTKSLDSEEINIEEEFEFLDEYELEEDKS